MASRPASASAAMSSSQASPVNAAPQASMPLLACRVVATAAERAAHFRIRHQVFVGEQGLFRLPVRLPGAAAEGDDTDALDYDPATVHVVGLANEAICGTVRLYPLPGTSRRWKGDRLAVLPGHRHLGLGAPLVRFAVGWAATHGGQEMEAYVQPANVAFFKWLGWRRTGGLVDYAGISHQRMLISFGPPSQRAAGR